MQENFKNYEQDQRAIIDQATQNGLNEQIEKLNNKITVITEERDKTIQ